LFLNSPASTAYAERTNQDKKSYKRARGIGVVGRRAYASLP